MLKLVKLQKQNIIDFSFSIILRLILVLLVFVEVAVSALPGFMVTIPRHLMTSSESDCGDFGVCFSLIGVSVITSMDTSRRVDASMSSKLLLVGEIKTDISLDL